MPGSSLGRHAAAARHAEGADLGVLRASARATRWKYSASFALRQRIAPFDVVEAQLVEPLGDQQLVLQREADAFALAAVAKRRVVDLDGRHKT